MEHEKKGVMTLKFLVFHTYSIKGINDKILRVTEALSMEGVKICVITAVSLLRIVFFLLILIIRRYNKLSDERVLWLILLCRVQ